RMQQAVAWVDLDRSKRTGITRLDLYGEGDVGLENGTESKSGGKVVCDLNTRGEVKFKGKVVQQVTKDDPLYKRALTETAAEPPPAPPPEPQQPQPAPRQEAPPAPPAGAPVPPVPPAPPPERRGPPRQITMVPRGTDAWNLQTIPLPNGETAYVITNGLQVLV